MYNRLTSIICDDTVLLYALWLCFAYESDRYIRGAVSRSPTFSSCLPFSHLAPLTLTPVTHPSVRDSRLDKALYSSYSNIFRFYIRTPRFVYILLCPLRYVSERGRDWLVHCYKIHILSSSLGIYFRIQPTL